MGRYRLMIQMVTAVVTNGYYQGFLEGKIFQGASKSMCVPGLNCYSCPGAIGSCPIGAMQAIANDRQFNIPYYVLGMLFMVGAVLGKGVCGFLCPFGLFQDLLHKIPLPFKFKKIKGDRFLKYLKYVMLVLFVLILPIFMVNSIGQGDPWFCKYVCPSGTLMVGWPLTILNESLRSSIGFLFAWKSFILIGLIVLSTMVWRPFCRYLCPLGAIYGCCNSFALLKFNVDDNKCISCKKCQNACKMDIATYLKPNSPECIRCGDCIKACPTEALTRQQWKITREKATMEIRK